jgi:hypothetical protein
MDEQNQPNHQDSFLNLLLSDDLQSALPRIAELLGKEKAIFSDRDQKLAKATHQRKIKRQNQPAHCVTLRPAFSI